MHFELHSAVNAMIIAPPVASYSERIYQIIGKDTLDSLLPIAAQMPLQRVGLPHPPPWARKYQDEEEEPGPVDPGELRCTDSFRSLKCRS